jgi:hypothetical protein
MEIAWTGVQPHQERWVVAGSAGFVLLCVVVLHLVSAYNIRHPELLLDGARRGAKMNIVLDPEICRTAQLGELVCGVLYVGKYSAATNTWKITGPTNLSNKLATASFNDAPPVPGGVSLWGLKGVFDNDGKLFAFGKVAGSVQFSKAASNYPLKEEAWRGASIEVVLSPEICEVGQLGELICGVPYVGKYDKTTNAWTFTGPTKLSEQPSTASFDNAPRKMGALSLWGLSGSFNDTGSLFVFGIEAGVVKLAPQKSW